MSSNVQYIFEKHILSFFRRISIAKDIVKNYSLHKENIQILFRNRIRWGSIARILGIPDTKLKIRCKNSSKKFFIVIVQRFHSID